MSTQQVADRLVELCNQGKNEVAIEELYADNIVSQEMPSVPQPRTEGKDAVIEKNKEWQKTVEEIHGGTISSPIVIGDFFTISMDMDVTFKERGRTHIQELAVYQVKDGKIVFEQFFYNMG